MATDREKAKRIFEDARTPFGLKIQADIFLGANAKLLLDGQPAPELGETLERFYNRLAASDPFGTLAPETKQSELPPSLAWLKDEKPMAEDTTDPSLPGPLAWLNR